MATPSHSRARTPDQKQQRERALIDAAWTLLSNKAYENITVAQVAEQAGLGKGTVFLYFKTKEELFLSVLRQQLENWFGEIDETLEHAPDACTSAQVVGWFTASLQRRPALLQLLTLTHGVIEPNAGQPALQAFRQALLLRMRHCGALLERKLPNLPSGEGVGLLMRMYALVIGVQHVTPSPTSRDAIAANPDLRVFDFQFDREISRMLSLLLSGIENRATAVA
jgi:AcrR family transcriptional regulator